MNPLPEEIVLVEFELYVYKDSERILDQKDLFQEIRDILGSIKRVDRGDIRAEFNEKGWTLDKKIVSETTWAWDAYKDKVAVSIEFTWISLKSTSK